MEEKIKLEFTDSKSTRRLVINVHPDGRVVVRKHPRLSEDLAMTFVNKKMPWIRKRLHFYKTADIYDWSGYIPDKKKSLEFVQSRIEYFNGHYKFKYGYVRVRNQKSVWGTCSAKKNLNFNMKIISLPPEQADYIIVHELCHTTEFNHSKQFWELVSQQIPDYKRIKNDLKLFSYN